MQQSAMTAIPISDLRTQQPEIIERLKDAPVLLTRQGYSAAVLVDPQQWNALIEESRTFKRLLRIERARRDLDAGKGISYDEAKAILEADGLL